MQPPAAGEIWVGLSDEPLPVELALSWVGRTDCGGVVLFCGTARDHSEGRPEVSVLEYEAYEEQVEPRLRTLESEARIRWPTLGRVALLHRTGQVDIGAAAVVVAVSAPTEMKHLRLLGSVLTVSKPPFLFGNVKPGVVARAGG